MLSLFGLQKCSESYVLQLCVCIRFKVLETAQIHIKPTMHELLFDIILYILFIRGLILYYMLLETKKVNRLSNLLMKNVQLMIYPLKVDFSMGKI